MSKIEIEEFCSCLDLEAHRMIREPGRNPDEIVKKIGLYKAKYRFWIPFEFTGPFISVLKLQDLRDWMHNILLVLNYTSYKKADKIIKEAVRNKNWYHSNIQDLRKQKWDAYLKKVERK